VSNQEAVERESELVLRFGAIDHLGIGCSKLKTLANHLYIVFVHLGGFGLLALGILDSSFLFAPFGADLLVIAMTARRYVLMPYYTLMATAGSLLGCAAIDWLGRKQGEKWLQAHFPRRRLEYVSSRVRKNAAWALALASLMPPPFPFTVFVAAASTLKYPRKKLFIVIGLSRLLRYTIEGVLAIMIGEKVLRLSRTRSIEDVIAGLVFISIAGSVISVYGWIKGSKRTRSRDRSNR
jgi:membrane protein YqaA with SNARE-associated domain